MARDAGSSLPLLLIGTWRTFFEQSFCTIETEGRQQYVLKGMERGNPEDHECGGGESNGGVGRWRSAIAGVG
jgi:hypothetical protein